MLLDVSVGGQSYIEDCETCCNPVQIDYTTLDSEIAYFEANSTRTMTNRTKNGKNLLG